MIATNISRQSAAIVSLLLLFGLSGCCSTGGRCETPPVVIDAHTHLFNARYLPIREIAASRGVPLNVAEGVENILLLLTPPSTLASSSRDLRAAARRKPNRPGTDFLDRISEAPLNEARKMVIDRVIAPNIEMLNENLTDEQRGDLLAYVRGENARAATSTPPELSPEDVARVLEKSQVLEDSHSLMSDPAIRGATLSGYLRFIGIVTSREQELFQGLKRTYPSVGLFVHHMMDMERTYNQQPDFPFPAQIDKMLSLQKEFPGQILTFGAFDPYRREQALLQAIEAYNKGVIGFKFYPPAGYRPSQNELPPSSMPGTVRRQYDSRYNGILATNLDQWNDEFFQFCQSNDIPIFSHCTVYGFQAVEGYGKISCDPEFWRPVLAKYPKLRLCFGHAGGADLWFGNSSSLGAGFAKTIIDLCSTYENVYCEAGYWDEVLKPGGPDLLSKNLTALLAAHPQLKRKLIYGTDWFMMSKEEGFGDYLCNMVQTTRNMDDFHAAFFAGNAARFLNLEALSRAAEHKKRLSPKVAEALGKVQTTVAKSERNRP
jgi:predicted TIM-barrel fold metal-dependent hydrolase